MNFVESVANYSCTYNLGISILLEVLDKYDVRVSVSSKGGSKLSREMKKIVAI